VLNDCADYLGQESRVLLLEQVEPDAEAFCEQVKFTSGQLRVCFVTHATLTKLIRGEHLADDLLSGLL